MKGKKHISKRGILVAEITIGVALLALWGVFFYCRVCAWDMVALIAWAVVLLLSGVLLFRAERRLRAEEERQG